jgi:hypothetical protein
MQPARELSSTGVCLASPGQEYVVYAVTNTAFTLDLSAAAGEKLDARWYNPRTGEFTAGAAGVAGRFAPPFGGDAVLHVKCRKR